MSVKMSQIDVTEFAKVYKSEVEKYLASGERGCRAAIARRFNGMSEEDVSSIASQLRKALKAKGSSIEIPMLPGKGRKAAEINLSDLESIFAD